MKLIIIPADVAVGVDGEFRQVDMTGIDPTIHAVHFDDGTGEGEVEFKERGRSPERIEDRSQFDLFVDRWVAAAPVPVAPLPPPDMSDPNNISKQERTLLDVIAAMTGKTEAEVKAAYTDKFKAKP